MPRAADITWDYANYRRITFGITKKSVGLHSGLQKKTVGLHLGLHLGLQKKTVGITAGLHGIIIRLHWALVWFYFFDEKQPKKDDVPPIKNVTFYEKLSLCHMGFLLNFCLKSHLLFFFNL